MTVLKHQFLVRDTQAEFDAAFTFPGMASFSTGLDYCGDCSFFQKYNRRMACAKYASMMRGTWGPAIPAHARSCKYFERRRP